MWSGTLLLWLGSPLISTRAAPSAACSACEALVTSVSDAIRSPPPFIGAATGDSLLSEVREGITSKQVPNVAYVDEVVQQLCNRTRLAAFRRTEGWWDARFHADHVPQYAADALFVEPTLIAQCGRLTGELRPHLLRNVVVSARHGRVPTPFCAETYVQACGPAEQRCIHTWTAALKLAPLVLILLSVPFLFVSMVRGAPDPVYEWGNAVGARKRTR